MPDGSTPFPSQERVAALGGSLVDPTPVAVRIANLRGDAQINRRTAELYRAGKVAGCSPASFGAGWQAWADFYAGEAEKVADRCDAQADALAASQFASAA